MNGIGFGSFYAFFTEFKGILQLMEVLNLMLLLCQTASTATLYFHMDSMSKMLNRCCQQKTAAMTGEAVHLGEVRAGGCVTLDPTTPTLGVIVLSTVGQYSLSEICSAQEREEGLAFMGRETRTK